MVGPFDNQDAPSSGKLLISEPFLYDSNFRRSVILLCEHEESGSVGFVLNRKLELYLRDVLDITTEMELPLYLGGPVQNNTLHFIHRPNEALPSSHRLTDDVYWGGDFVELLPLLEQGSIDPNDIRLFLGYSGWSSGQLSKELDAKTWIVGQGTGPIVFANDHEKMWNRILRSMGGAYKVLSNSPDSPQMN